MGMQRGGAGLLGDTPRLRDFQSFTSGQRCQRAPMESFLALLNVCRAPEDKGLHGENKPTEGEKTSENIEKERDGIGLQRGI